MFDDDYEQDDFFSESNSDFSQQDNDDSADFFNNDENFTQSKENQTIQKDSHTNLGYKTVGIVVAIILAILALIVIGLSNIHLVKKTSNNQQQTQQQTQQEQQKTQVATEKSTTTESTKSTEELSNTSSKNTMIPSASSTTLTDVPSSTYIDYSSKVISSQGIVQKLSRYLQDGQVIYCIDLSITIGTTSTSVKYYCGYNVYKQVKVGDILTVDYQQVSDTCFSVCTIAK